MKKGAKVKMMKAGKVNIHSGQKPEKNDSSAVKPSKTKNQKKPEAELDEHESMFRSGTHSMGGTKKPDHVRLGPSGPLMPKGKKY